MSPLIDICPVADLPPGEFTMVDHDDIEIGVFNCDGTFLAVEDRCSHDDGDLLEGSIDFGACQITCPRHDSVFDLKTGRPLNLPAYQPIETFDVVVEGDMIRLEVE